MGLQSQLIDVSSDSIPLLFVALIANCVYSLRNFLSTLLHSTRLRSTTESAVDDPSLLDSGLLILAEQLNLNRIFSYTYCGDVNSCGGGSVGSDCVVCLCTLRDGDVVRKLDCRHVFHKECFDGWLDHLNFNCPLCRLPLIADERRVESTRRRVDVDVIG